MVLQCCLPNAPNIVTVKVMKSFVCQILAKITIVFTYVTNIKLKHAVTKRGAIDVKAPSIIPLLTDS